MVGLDEGTMSEREEQERAEFSYYGKLNAGDWFYARGVGVDIGLPVVGSNDGSLQVSYKDKP